MPCGGARTSCRPASTLYNFSPVTIFESSYTSAHEPTAANSHESQGPSRSLCSHIRASCYKETFTDCWTPLCHLLQHGHAVIASGLALEYLDDYSNNPGDQACKKGIRMDVVKLTIKRKSSAITPPRIPSPIDVYILTV